MSILGAQVGRRPVLVGLALLFAPRPKRNPLYPAPNLYPSTSTYPMGG